MNSIIDFLGRALAAIVYNVFASAENIVSFYFFMVIAAVAEMCFFYRNTIEEDGELFSRVLNEGGDVMEAHEKILAMRHERNQPFNQFLAVMFGGGVRVLFMLFLSGVSYFVFWQDSFISARTTVFAFTVLAYVLFYGAFFGIHLGVIIVGNIALLTRRFKQ